MAQMIKRGLDEEGHLADVCTTGTSALEQALSIPYDVIVLDWALPDLDGVSVVRSWRDRGLRIPVLMLTARGTTGEKVTALRAGADDYLVKPFDFEELVARLEALHRRGAGHEPVTKLGSLQLDSRRRVIRTAQAELALTAREYSLFLELAGHAGEVLTRSQLIQSVWGAGFDGGPNVVDVYIGYLRNKLERIQASDVTIRSVRGVGYRLAVERGQAA
jgi:DNA-binding response OmpR family regulator